MSNEGGITEPMLLSSRSIVFRQDKVEIPSGIDPDNCREDREEQGQIVRLSDQQNIEITGNQLSSPKLYLPDLFLKEEFEETLVVQWTLESALLTQLFHARQCQCCTHSSVDC